VKGFAYIKYFLYLCQPKDIKLIDMDTLKCNKKKHVSNYFRTIDSETKAYILGYLVADGSIEESTRKDRPSKLVRLRFGCITEDDEILKLIQREIAPNNKLRYYQPKEQNHKQTTILQICDKELINDLRTLYNIQPRKTYKNDFNFPNIPKKYERDFIRGFIDGDGSIGRHHFSMICNSERFAVQIRDKFLEKIPELKSYIYKENRKYTDYWSLHFSMNLKIAGKLYNYLYSGASVFLKRKESILNTVLNAVDKRTAQCRA
jgi:hypothetical protein